MCQIMKTIFKIESEMNFGITVYCANALKTIHKNDKFYHKWYTTPYFLSEEKAMEHLNAMLANKKYKDYQFKHISHITIFA